MLKAKAKMIGLNRFITGYYVCLQKVVLNPCDSADKEKENEEHFIIFDEMSDWGLPYNHKKADVDGETVCMCSGMRDNNNNLIYENDIVSCYLKKYNGIVKFNDGCFDIEFEDGSRDYLKCYVANHAVTVKGNLFD